MLASRGLPCSSEGEVCRLCPQRRNRRPEFRGHLVNQGAMAEMEGMAGMAEIERMAVKVRLDSLDSKVRLDSPDSKVRLDSPDSPDRWVQWVQQ